MNASPRQREKCWPQNCSKKNGKNVNLHVTWAKFSCSLLKKNLNASRPSEHSPVGGEMSKRLGGVIGCKDKTSSSEHPPVRGENVKTFRWDHRLQIQNLFMTFKRVPRWQYHWVNIIISGRNPPLYPPVRGENVKTFRWDHRLQIQNLFMAFKRVKKSLNAAKPPEQSKGLGGNIGCKDKNST